MRRTLGLLLPALLAFAVLLSPAAAVADDAGEVVLAVEGEPTGPQPQERLSEDNPARDLAGYEDREVQFTWGAAFILIFLGAAGLFVMVGLYYLLVHRPAQEAGVSR
jgi:hypothetical protein